MKVKFKNFVEALQYYSQEQPDKIAYTFLEDGEHKESTINYFELDKKARSLAVTLQSEMALGERALLLYPPSLDYVIAFLGCLYAGVIPIPAYPPDTRNLIRLENIIEDAGASVALSVSSIIANVQHGTLSQSSKGNFNSVEYLKKRVKWISTDSINTEISDNWVKPTINPGDIAFLQYTSGSTGKPKGVMVTHDNLVYNSALIKTYCQITEDDCIVSWLPPYHDMGLIAGILQALYGGIPGILMSPMAFLKRPIRWLKAITNAPIKGNIISGAPNFAYDLCIEKISEEQLQLLDLSKWSICYTGAEPIRADTINRFAEKFAGCGFTKKSFYPVYGLAEATLIASAGVPGALPIIERFNSKEIEKNKIVITNNEDHSYTLVGCGNNLMGQEMLIVNPDTLHVCKKNEVGEIWMSGPSIAKGYWNNEAQTSEIFSAFTKDYNKGPFLRTGDLGFLKEGELFVTGRLKDLIIIRGSNHYPQDIETTVADANEALRPGCGAAFSIDKDGEERLVIVQEVKRQYVLKYDAQTVIPEIIKAVSLNHSLNTYAVILIEPSSFPKTSSGKLQRRECKKMYLEGSLQIKSEWHFDKHMAAMSV